MSEPTSGSAAGQVPGAGGHFDRVAPTYERGRPPYPPQVYDHLTERGLLRPGAALLEVGAGTGQATIELLRRGAAVDAIEPGAELALRLRLLPGPVTVHESTVEEADLPEAAYDAVVAATSLHWVDLPAVLPALHRALRPGGLLAAWWTVFGDPEVRTPFRDRVDEIARETGRAGDPAEVPRPLRVADRVAELEEGGWFEAEEPALVRWSLTRSPAQLRDLFHTFPTWGDDPAALDRIEKAARECGPAIEEHYVTAIYLARHSSASSA